jgi:tetratricopeptide (TPR) repeat protein
VTPISALILLLEDFQRLGPIGQLSALAGCISVLGGSIFWAWHKGRKYVAELVETNGKLKQQFKDSAIRTRKIEQRIEEHDRTLAILRAQVPAAVLARATAEKAQAREILSALFDQLAPAIATCCREMADVELALTVDAGDRPHLERAKRLAQTAHLLSQESRLSDLLAEINAIRAVWQEKRGSSPTADMHWNAAFDYVGEGGQDVALLLIPRLNDTAMQRYREGHYGVAAVMLRRTALLADRNFGREHPDTLTTRNDLAAALQAQGRSAEAEPIFREVLALREKVLGHEHPDTLTTRNNLAAALQAQGRSAEAEAIFREVLPLQEKVLGHEHPGTLATRSNLARVIEARGRSAEYISSSGVTAGYVVDE